MATTTNSPTAAAPGRTAASVMTPDPRTCSPFSTITEAALIFREEDCGVVPVVDEGKPVGILTDRDIALASAAYPDLARQPVSSIMSRDLVTVPRDAPLGQVERASTENAVRRALVLDDDGRLAGIISWADLSPRVPESDLGHVVSEVVERPGPDGRSAHPESSEASKVHDPGKGTETQPQQSAATAASSLSPGAIASLLKETVRSWFEDKVPRLGAALAFYSVLSLAPLLLIAIAVAALFFGEEAARGHLVGQIRGLVGQQGGKAIETMLAHAHEPTSGTVASIVGIVTLIVGATGVVGQLQDALNTIWEVAPKPGRGLWGFFKDRFLSLALILGFGFLLLVSLVLSTLLNAVSSFFVGLLSQAAPVLEAANFAVTFVVVTLLFAMIFKLLPDVHIAWSDVWFGAVLTAILFVVGKTVIGLYLGRSGLDSTYGAAGSLVVLLVWVYYSSLIVFFGAEFTKAYADRYGSRIVPASDAVPLTEEARAQQGIPRSKDVAAAAHSG